MAARNAKIDADRHRATTLRGRSFYVNGDMAETIQIRSERDLWAVLASAPEDKAIPSVAPLSFQRWSPKLFYFPTESIGHSVSPTLARSISAFHNSLSRAYAYAAYGQSDARLLRTLDADALEIILVTIKGSNGLKLNRESLERLANTLVHKLSGDQVTKLLAFIILLFFGTTAMKDWLHEEYRAKERIAERDSALNLSKEETKRMELMASVLNRNPNWKPIKAMADEARVPLVRGTLQYDSAEILGVPIHRDQARAIVTKEREKSEGRRIDGVFQVIDINVDNPEGFIGVLRDPRTQNEIRISINRGELPDADMHALFSALEKKGTIEAMINAFYIGNKVTYASIVRATARP